VIFWHFITFYQSIENFYSLIYCSVFNSLSRSIKNAKNYPSLHKLEEPGLNRGVLTIRRRGEIEVGTGYDHVGLLGIPSKITLFQRQTG